MARQGSAVAAWGDSAASNSSRVPVGPEVGESADVRVPHGSETKRKRRGGRLCFGWARVGPRASAQGLLPTGGKEKGGVAYGLRKKNSAGRQLALGRIGGESNEKYFSKFCFLFSFFQFQTEFKYESDQI